MNADGRTRLHQTPEWTALAKHREELADTHLRELFAADPGRGEGYTLQVGDLYLDYSKHLVTDETLRLLRELAAATDVFGLRDAMFRGERLILSPRNMASLRPNTSVAAASSRSNRRVSSVTRCFE